MNDLLKAIMAGQNDQAMTELNRTLSARASDLVSDYKSSVIKGVFKNGE